MKLDLTINLPPLPDAAKSAQTKSARLNIRLPEYLDESMLEEPLENEKAAIKFAEKSDRESLSLEIRSLNEKLLRAGGQLQKKVKEDIPPSLSSAAQKPSGSMQKVLDSFSKRLTEFRAAQSNVRRTYATQLLLKEDGDQAD